MNSGVKFLEKFPYMSEDETPDLEYKRYLRFRAAHGIEINGWPDHLKGPEGNLLNPTDWKHIDDFRQMYRAITQGELDWNIMSKEEWDVAQNEMGVVATQASLSSGRTKVATKGKGGQGKGKGKGKGKDKGKVVRSAAVIESSDDDESDGQDGSAGE